MNTRLRLPFASRVLHPHRSWIIWAFFLAATLAHAQTGWKSEITRDGKVQVLSRITIAKAADGTETPIVEYNASTTARAEFQHCLTVLRDVSKHKLIHDDHSSETIKVLSENERIVHYGLKVVWPLPKIDCVARMVVLVDSVARTATITLTGAPDQLAPRAERRLSQYQQTYTLKDLGGGSVELRSAGRSAPPFAVPKWMLKAAFPAAAADPLLKIVELSKETGSR